PWLAALAAQQLDPLAVDPQLLRARAPGGGQTGPRLEPPDAGRGLAGQIVGAPAGVRLEIEKALVFTLQGGKQRQQRHMLVDVRKVAGVVLVTVFQAEDLREQQVTKRPRAAPWAAGSSPARGLAAQSAAGDFAPMNDSGKQRQQRHMLVDVRKVAGVVLVPVFHIPPRSELRRELREPDWAGAVPRTAAKACCDSDASAWSVACWKAATTSFSLLAPAAADPSATKLATMVRPSSAPNVQSSVTRTVGGTSAPAE